MIRLLTAFAFATLTATASGQTPAQQTPPQPPTPEATDDLRPAEVQRLFDAFVVVQIPDALALSEDQYSRLLPKLRQLQQARRQGQQQRLRMIGELTRLTNPKLDPPTDEAVLKERLRTLQELESRTAAELRRAYDAVDEILDTRQRARFRAFEEQIERRKLQLLLRARQNRPPPSTRPR